MRYHYGQAYSGMAGRLGKVVQTLVGKNATKKPFADKAYKPKSKKVIPSRKSRKLIEPVQMDGGHSGVSSETIRVKATPLKLRKGIKTIGRWNYQQTHNGIIIGTAGTQTVTDICLVNGTSQIITSSGPGYGFFQNATALQQLNPYLSTSSSVVVGVATPFNDRFVILRNQVKLEITNFSGVGALVDVYLMKCKKSDASSCSSIWATSLIQDGLGQVAAVRPVAGSNTGTAGYASDVNFVGLVPSQSKTFKGFHQIQAVKHIDLSGNSTELVNFDIEINKVVNTGIIREEDGTLLRLHGGLTYSVMIVQRGQLVEDKTVGTLVTYGSTKIGYIATVKSQMCALAGNASRLDDQRVISNVPAGATTANQSYTNEVDTPTTVLASTA